jgi:hypothetical protein
MSKKNLNLLLVVLAPSVECQWKHIEQTENHVIVGRAQPEVKLHPGKKKTTHNSTVVPGWKQVG